MTEYDSVKVKDQLGRPEDKGITIKRFDDTVIPEVGPTEVFKRDITNSFILSDATNGRLGVYNGAGGKQIVLGWDDRDKLLTVVSNPNKIFHEHFRHTYFKDAATTADWAVSEGQLNFTTGEIAQSTSIALLDGTIYKSTINVIVFSGSVSNLAFQLSADGGSHWENVTHATEHSFTVTGTDLRFKITASGTVTVTDIDVAYS